MAITSSTIKRLFAKSQNKCAIPRCTSALIMGDHVVGEICHIRARRKKGPRYDPNLTAAEKDDSKNLILLCPTCHTIADNDPQTHSVERLTEIKQIHERGAALEITAEMTRQALMILARHEARAAITISHSPVTASPRVTAFGSGVAISVGGHNLAPISVHPAPKAKTSGTRYPANSIGADANMTNYIEYLCQLYVNYMAPIETDTNKLWKTLGRHIKGRFRLRKKTRNHLSVDRFPDLVNYLIQEKLAGAPVGKKHLRDGTKLCRSFEEFRYSPM